MTAQQLKAAQAKKKPSKYRNEPSIYDGQRFDSILEMNRYRELELMRIGGHVKWFIRQAPFRLPGGVVYRADFLIVWGSGLAQGEKTTVEDCKGTLTQASANKIKQVKAIYGVDVVLVKRAASR